MEPPRDVGNENLFKCSRSHDHVHINYGEKLQKSFSSEPRGRWLKLGIQHRVLEYYQYFICWPWDDLDYFLWQGQICFRMLLHGWKLIQHWVLMYFQVCSNSTYPQHSGEWYRTSGPMVWKWDFFWCPKNSTNMQIVVLQVHFLQEAKCGLKYCWKQQNPPVFQIWLEVVLKTTKPTCLPNMAWNTVENNKTHLSSKYGLK